MFLLTNRDISHDYIVELPIVTLGNSRHQISTSIVVVVTRVSFGIQTTVARNSPFSQSQWAVWKLWPMRRRRRFAPFPFFQLSSRYFPTKKSKILAIYLSTKNYMYARYSFHAPIFCWFLAIFYSSVNWLAFRLNLLVEGSSVIVDILPNVCLKWEKLSSNPCT